jgi:hypothetical protein
MPILGTIASSTRQGLSTSSYESIQTQTVGSGGASSITFSSIPSTYKHLQIRATMMCSAVNNMYLQVGNGSIDTGGNYAWHQLFGNGAAPFGNGNGSASFGYIGYNYDTGYPNPSIIDIVDYANTSKLKTWKSFAGTSPNGGNGYIQIWGGLWTSTSAINTVKITPGGGSFSQYASFALYGIKG